ncbi:Fatty acid hydroxylase superfamily protein [Roseovarius albus]|uniref:Fatty acid hydroxylase superfamily protein n=1 Tax=Roseovarius albus TaxID=1247867 RepID=A0A1X6ZL54_9RHOB|nr:sterol desaturase family protein [Roseovarius albus]SLN54338.1 Fatty acid hydroxylase superfamily protein [Roseovarius albus]
MDTILAYINHLLDAPFSLNVRYSAFYLCCTVIIAYAIWKFRGGAGSFTKWLLPKEVYHHKSNMLDIKLFFAVRFFASLGLLGAVFFPTTVAYIILDALAGADHKSPPSGWTRCAIATAIIVITSDFCKYWAHRAHHEWRVLWPFHAVHHSADVLTPLTVERVHPVEPIIRNILMTVIVGLVQGLALYTFVGKVDIVTIGGANAFYFAFNALGSNFRHSHIWISYGWVIEHILISPAQHQVHHSVARRHHDKNYGSIFALWDWMFGTLYIPTEREKLTFGVSDGTGEPIEQPYPTLVSALVLPFKESSETILRSVKTTPGLTQSLPPNTTKMTEGFSLWLDVLRAIAALTVLFGHMAHVRFTRGDYYFLREWNVASDAVAVFFVLSGVVIAYSARRDGNLGTYAFKRATRIASVLFPALILTLVFDAVGTRINMSAYPRDYYQALPLSEFVWRGMTVTNLWTGVSDWVRLGTNGPIWSLSYEVGFYLIFGSFVFLKGLMRAVVLATLVLLVGIPILALLPAWWLGVLLWNSCAKTSTTPTMASSWFMAIAGLAILVALKVAGVPQQLENLTIFVLQPHNHHSILVYSNEVLWNTVVAACIAIHLRGIWNLTQRMKLNNDTRVTKAVRWVAGGSFSIYLVHYPTLHLIDATLPETLPAYDLWMLGLTLAVCFGFAALFERPLKRFRSILKKMSASLTEVRPNGRLSP